MNAGIKNWCGQVGKIPKLGFEKVKKNEDVGYQQTQEFHTCDPPKKFERHEFKRAQHNGGVNVIPPSEFRDFVGGWVWMGNDRAPRIPSVVSTYVGLKHLVKRRVTILGNEGKCGEMGKHAITRENVKKTIMPPN